jgi:hypothetical protein
MNEAVLAPHVEACPYAGDVQPVRSFDGLVILLFFQLGTAENVIAMIEEVYTIAGHCGSCGADERVRLDPCHAKKKSPPRTGAK